MKNIPICFWLTIAFFCGVVVDRAYYFYYEDIITAQAIAKRLGWHGEKVKRWPICRFNERYLTFHEEKK